MATTSRRPGPPRCPAPGSRRVPQLLLLDRERSCLPPGGAGAAQHRGQGDADHGDGSGWAGALWKEGSGGDARASAARRGCCWPEESPSLERRRLRGVTSAPETCDAEPSSGKAAPATASSSASRQGGEGRASRQPSPAAGPWASSVAPPAPPLRPPWCCPGSAVALAGRCRGRVTEDAALGDADGAHLAGLPL